MKREEKVYSRLDRLGIVYTCHQHPPVFTIEQASEYTRHLPGAHCKNLFLRNKKGNRHYLVILEQSQRANIRSLTEQLGEDRLSFASQERLLLYLGLESGAVSPFGLLNDEAREVCVVIDQDLKAFEQIYFHPNVNTATVGISLEDFEKFLQACGHDVRWI